MTVHTYRRSLASPLAQDVAVAAALVLLALVAPTSALTVPLLVAGPLVVAFAVATLHFPTRIALDADAITFAAYGREHRFAWRDVRSVNVRRFLVRDRVLVRLAPSPPGRGRYWILASIDGFDALVAALEARAALLNAA